MSIMRQEIKALSTRGWLKGLLAWSLMLFCLSCETRNDKVLRYPDPNFNAGDWKKDSTGCSNYRERACVNLAKNEDFFRGKTRAFLLQLLGPPSFPFGTVQSTSSLAYVVECTEMLTPKATASPQAKLMDRNYSANEAAALVFYMKQDVCTSVGIIEP